MILYLFTACFETTSAIPLTSLGRCDELSLRLMQCGKEADSFSLVSRCGHFESQRQNVDDCLTHQSCDELSLCLTELEKKPWDPHLDPDFCEAFRLKKLSLLNLFQARLKADPTNSMRYRRIFWGVGAECETDEKLAQKCYPKEEDEMLTCILNSSDLLPSLSLPSESK